MNDDLLGDPSEPRVTRNYKTNEVDYTFLRSVFPEHGLVTTIAGVLTRKLVNELHRNNLTTLDARYDLALHDAKKFFNQNVKITITLNPPAENEQPN
jgi:hypothetical protein